MMKIHRPQLRQQVRLENYQGMQVGDQFMMDGQPGLYKLASPTEIERLPNRKERRRIAKEVK
jgi:hypothetical protein